MCFICLIGAERPLRDPVQACRQRYPFCECKWEWRVKCLQPDNKTYMCPSRDYSWNSAEVYGKPDPCGCAPNWNLMGICASCNKRATQG
jgi:hypothetical protein